MGYFLRDQKISSLTVNADNLAQINAVFADRLATLNASIDQQGREEKRAFLNYIIRFDNKGYRVFFLEDLLRYFNQAEKVERIIFTVETGESLQSNRKTGTSLELRLDQTDSSACFLTATSDDKDWVDASFSAVQDGLTRCKNKNGWARSAWTQFGVQIIGISLGFVLSLWAASKLAPLLAIQDSFMFAFLFVLLIFSNTWTYLNQRILSMINTLFPNIKFHRPSKERMQWLLQAIVGGIVLAVVLYLLSLASSFLLDFLGSVVRKSN
jgi:hypothetical protein